MYDRVGVEPFMGGGCEDKPSGFIQLTNKCYTTMHFALEVLEAHFKANYKIISIRYFDYEYLWNVPEQKHF